MELQKGTVWHILARRSRELDQLALLIPIIVARL